MKLRVILSCLVALFFAVNATAEGLSIEPGQWEMTMTMTMSMMPQPQTTTVSECMTEDVLSPESFNMDKDNPCDITNVTFEGNTARWSINCPTEGGPPMAGQWEITSKGDSLTGNGSMSANFSGQEMSFTMNWDGKRVGDCK
jgi:hypothetical protein